MPTGSRPIRLSCEIHAFIHRSPEFVTVEDGFEVHYGGATLTIPDQSPGTIAKCLDRLRKFLDYYAFFAEVPLEMANPPDVYDGKQFKSVHERVYYEIEGRKHRRALASTLSLYKNSIPRHLAIALAFYRRALVARFNGEDDDALIDLVTSLESMFSLDPDELKYRLSLRVSYFLAGRNSERRKQYSDTVMAMYKLRSKIVHGSVMPHNLDFRELGNFTQLVREAIAKLILQRLSKKELIHRIDLGIQKGSQPDVR
jgi:hypothetical protein